VNLEKNKKYQDEIIKQIDELAKEQHIKLIPRAAIRQLEGTAQEEAIANYMKLSKMAKTKMNLSEFPPVDVADFVDHIDYLVAKMGIDHVGISSDFDGGGGVEGWNDASETLNVTIELVKRGYTEKQIAQLWNGNVLRVLDQVEKIAKEIQASS
jgi:microsomal dipeptidase-like Zn-dependent dipeptidase